MLSALSLDRPHFTFHTYPHTTAGTIDQRSLEAALSALGQDWAGPTEAAAMLRHAASASTMLDRSAAAAATASAAGRAGGTSSTGVGAGSTGIRRYYRFKPGGLVPMVGQYSSRLDLTGALVGVHQFAAMMADLDVD